MREGRGGGKGFQKSGQYKWLPSLAITKRPVSMYKL